MIIAVKNFLSLVRFSHTLFALPFALAAMFLAAEGWPPLKIVLLILAAMVTARNSAMAFNRLIDASLDAKNPRTASRHLPQKKMTRQSVLFFIFANSLLFISVAFFINRLAFLLSPVALGFIFAYSFSKRWTAACHFFLGLCLALSPVGAWIAVRGTIELPPLLMASALLLWVSGFDIIYSTLDVDFDRREGLYSFPAKWGIAASLTAAALLHAGTVAVMVLFGLLERMDTLYFVGVALIAAVIFWEHLMARRLDPKSVNRAFFNANAIVSLLFFWAVVIEVFTPTL